MRIPEQTKSRFDPALDYFIESREANMAGEVWLPLSSDERTLLREALAAYAAIGDMDAAIALSKKIARTPPHPDITVGVHGGQVQWALGNPFPIRVCDYDGSDPELPDVDERGQRCRMWFEPADEEMVTA